jgi:hypothetical protein
MKRLVALLALLHLPCWVSCSSCRDTAFVAELVELERRVDRDFGRAPETWSPAKKGDRFELGDGVRTGAMALATLALPRRARLLVKSDTVVRFKRSLDDSSPHDQIEMSKGEVTIETGALDLGVSTSRGVVKLATESRVRMRAESQKTRFDVVVGRVEYSLDGAAHTVAAGNGFDLEVLRASVEKDPAPFAATAPPEPRPTSLEENAKAPPDEPAVEGGSGKRLSDFSFPEPPPAAILTIPAGESATIHDPAPPTDVRITFSGCSELGVLELDRGNGKFDGPRARGDGEALASIPKGTYRYRLRCVHGGRVQNPAVRTGKLIVVPDAATRPLPNAPATITADADGRRYTISYQNRLPIITLRWPDAPRVNAFQLFVKPEQGAQFSVDSNKSSVTLAPGRVGEGVHQFWFETRDGKRSERGNLHVSFDFTARTAYLTSPVEGESAQGGTARFAGGVLIGSTVQAGGTALKLDGQGRFSTNVEVPAAGGGAYVRVQHRSTGIHYYLRHLR